MSALDMSEHPLSVRNLTVESVRAGAEADAVVLRDASLTLEPGGSLGIAGESGSGKTTLAQALFGYVRRGLEARDGTVSIRARELAVTRPSEFAFVRGRFLALVPQNTHGMLDPIVSIGGQLAEVARVAGIGDAAVTRERSLELLSEAGFPQPAEILERYPHQLSGGQRQRVAICMALLASPDVLVLDEGTTDLDVITQVRIIRLIKRLQAAHGFAILGVSHDLRILASLCDDLMVMHQGRVVERGPLRSLLLRPEHPYTAQLVKRFLEGPLSVADTGAPDQPGAAQGCSYRPLCPLAVAKCETPPPAADRSDAGSALCWRHAEVHEQLGLGDRAHWWAKREDAVAAEPAAPARAAAAPAEPQPGSAGLHVDGLWASHRGRGVLGSRVDVLKDVSLSAFPGETIGIVGESGSGKTTLARVLIGLHRPKAGTVTYEGFDLATPARRRPLWVRRQLQIVLQNPQTALNPRHTVADILLRRVQLFEEAATAAAARDRVLSVLDSVGLPPSYLERRSSRLSGGEKQRVAIARALIGDPRIIVCDEILSSLDVITQALIVQLMRRIQDERNLCFVFISHDVGLTAAIADRMIVFRAGEISDAGPTQELLEHSRDEYTRELIAGSLFTPEDLQ